MSESNTRLKKEYLNKWRRADKDVQDAIKWLNVMLEDCELIDTIPPLTYVFKNIYENYEGLVLIALDTHADVEIYKVAVFKLDIASKRYNFDSLHHIDSKSYDEHGDALPIGTLFYIKNLNIYTTSEIVDQASSYLGHPYPIMLEETIIVYPSGGIYSMEQNFLLRHASSIEDFFVRFYDNTELFKFDLGYIVGHEI